MGTNYYTKTEKCPHCGHRPEGIHLGKSSAGWQFSFQYNGGKFYKNVEEMKVWLKDKTIENEYGEEVSHEYFWKMVEEKQKEKLNHADYMSLNYPGRDTDFIIGGYSFTDCEFS